VNKTFGCDSVDDDWDELNVKCRAIRRSGYVWVNDW